MIGLLIACGWPFPVLLVMIWRGWDKAVAEVLAARESNNTKGESPK